MALGSTQPLAEMITRNLPGGKGRRARKADNLPPCVSQLSRKYGSLDVLLLCRPPRPVTGIAYFYMAGRVHGIGSILLYILMHYFSICMQKLSKNTIILIPVTQIVLGFKTGTVQIRIGIANNYTKTLRGVIEIEE
jgi:hypothetical protein